MFITTRKHSSGYKYLYLMESRYNKKTKKSQKLIVKNFGNLDTFIKDHPDEYAELMEKYGNKKEKMKNAKEQTLNRFMDSNVNVDLSALQRLKRTMPQNYSHLVLRRLWKDELQMHKHFDYILSHEKSDIQFSPTEIALYFATLKITSPMSYLSGLEESPRYLGDPMAEYTTDDVYRCLHFLSEHKDSIMGHVNRKVDELVPREKSLLFFDCTNCYFETPYNDEYWFRKKVLRQMRSQLRKEEPKYATLSDRELNQLIDNDLSLSELFDMMLQELGDPIRMNGPSKEKRTDLPLVSIALVIDENAIPIDFMVFSGNKAEAKTMIESVKNLKGKYKIKNAILVADSALNGTKNLCQLLEEKLGFSVAKSALSFSQDIREQELDLSTFSKIKDESGQETNLLYKVIDYHTTKYDPSEKDENGKSKKYTLDCKLMLTFSEERQNRDLAIIEDNVRRAELAIYKQENIEQYSSGWKQFVLTKAQTESVSSKDDKNIADKKKKKKDKSVNIATALNQESIDKRRKCAGYAGILYHEAPDAKEEFTPEYVSTLYHHLVQIEECFRIIKSDFEIRPLYVRDKDSIQGHVLLCILALIMVRLIQKKLAKTGRSITAAQLKEVLNNMKMMTLFFDEQNCIYIKSEEALRRNCLRKQDDKYKQSDKVNADDLLEVLGLNIDDSVNTLEQLRSQFKIKSLNRSEYQSELLKKYYAVNQ